MEQYIITEEDEISKTLNRIRAFFIPTALIMGLFITLVAVIVLPRWIENKTPSRPIFLQPEDCDLNQEPCKAQLNEQLLEINISPKPLQTMTPLSIEVRLASLSAQSVRINFQGVDMYMGLNSSELQRLHNIQDNQESLWQGDIQIPICLTGSMTWRAHIEISSGSEYYETHFDFNLN